MTVLLPNVVFAGWAPILWDTSGVNIRQGYHIEWFRAGASNPVTGDQVYTYSDCREGDRDVYAQKIDVNGNLLWGEGGKLICRDAGRQEDSEVIYSGNGNWIFAWVDYRRTPDVIEAGDVWALKVDSEGDPLWSPNGEPVCIVEGIQISLRLVDDGAGGVIIVWEDNRNDGNDLYAQHLTSSGQIAPGWSPDGLPVIEYVGRQEELTVDTDGHGGAIVAWKDMRLSGNNDIYAQRVRPNGTLAWDPDGKPICLAGFDQSGPKLCPDGHGGAYIVWIDKRNDQNFGDLYFQRIDSSGHSLYQNNGDTLCDANQEQNECRIMTADDGGAIFTWVDFRNDPSNILGDIYAQKVDPAGNALWSANGVVVCNAAQQQWGARFTSDGANGAIVGWEDIRNGNDIGDADIYAQRISSSGAPMWLANGVLISDADDYQNSVLLKSDLTHGAFLVWATQAGSASLTVQSLSIQHVNSTGQIQLPQNGVEFHSGIDGDSKDPIMVKTSDSRFLVLWRDLRNGGIGCLYMQLMDTSANVFLEPNGRSLCGGAADGNMASPRFVSDLANGALLVWEDNRSTSLFTQVYAQRIDNTGTPLWTPGGVHVFVPNPGPEDQQASPYVAPDGTGGAFVLWSGTVSGRIYVFAQKLNASGARVWANPIQVSNGVLEDICFGAVPDGEGGVITTWKGGAWPSFKVYGQKLDSNGNAQWDTNGTLVCPADSNQDWSTVIADGNGGAFFAWEDKRDSVDYNIVAQHIDRSGNLVWPDSGLTICNAISDQGSISMVLDTYNNNDNVFFLWQDFRNASEDVYLQKVTSAGEILCEDNGFPVCTTEYDQPYPVMAYDQGGGVYITWEDWRQIVKSDLFGTHINGDCEYVHEFHQWSVNGDSVNNELFKQLGPAIAPDGDGGAIIAWEDGRSSGKEETFNLFLQRVNDWTTSPVISESEPVPVTFHLEQNYPNPFNPATRIRYDLSHAGFVKLVIYDVLGRRVRVLENRMMPAGSHEVVWNGKTASGSYASSGIYFYRLQAGSRSEVRKMVLLK